MSDNTSTPHGSGASATTGLRPMPKVNKITVNDVIDAFAAGLADFRRAPVYGLAIGAFFALGGLFVVLSAAALNMSYLSYPAAAGFVLIGPFAAVGLYEVSRRLQNGEELSWSRIFGTMWAQKGRELSWMAFVVLFIQIMWMYQVRLLLALFLGFRSFASFDEFLTQVISTPEGLMFLAVGHVVGAILSLILFSLTVVSFPLLMEEDRDFITAMITSVRAVFTSPVPMIGWAFVVTAVLIVSMAPAFLGLVVSLPILGHTTWHLYKKCVEIPEETL
ncbi:MULTISPECIES: DUF2189 domain-containing protein [Stappiaceae]|uniref:Putative integral membrane protein n=2 Tax=Stappiaceae TaxID=2821832 RepID=A0A0M6Y534_9HYPH|nr:MULTISPECIES: DUF2189 domain-containing protein [unclassified Labrenzia]QFS96196.1 hypothetical protein FIV06_02120 [Labrenzia sp. THAF191b]QFT02511.1 hypothetical protein FIV05_02120 [Labrenzia sp. THAF191a]QFT14053.1 hypothetical protein FIV03_02125 [Labrenzia sp. THAF187b]CTQ44663.1 putative integral membrane protein [Roseibium aggregatum]